MAGIGTQVAADAAGSAPDPLLVVGADDTIAWANRAAIDLLHDGELVGSRLTAHLDLDPSHSLSNLRTSAPRRALGMITDAAEHRVPVEISVAPVEGNDDQWVLRILRLPRNELSMRELLRRANTEPLTNLANRSHFIESVEATFRDRDTRGLPYALVMLDLDGFKRINDTWGHDAGDAVLLALAERLERACRPGDVVARLGGDEFAIWCRRLDTEHTMAFLERIRGVFDEPVPFRGVDLAIAGSIGCSTTDRPRPSLDLMREADMAMYHAKAQGPGNIHVFDDGMRDQTLQRIALEQELRRALPSNDLSLVYQPIVRVNDGMVVAAEALVRWHHPRLGQLRPADFFPILDKAALRASLDAGLVPRAIAQLAEWNADRRVPLSMWINLSPVSLTRAVFERIEAALAEHGVAGEQIVVELGEESSLNDTRSLETIAALRDLGVRLALDDFGTGKANLDVLPDLDLDYVKLDKSFVRGVAENANRRALCRSVIGLAHALGARIVAEGIEGPNDLTMVTELGADLLQGYHLARPAPVGSVLGIDAIGETIDLRAGSTPTLTDPSAGIGIEPAD